MAIDPNLVKKLKPYVLVILLQFGNAGFGIVAKAALNKGTSHFTFSVYRNAIAAVIFLPFAFFLERKIRPAMTTSVFFKILLLSLFDPVIGQNLFYAGLSYTSATVTAALGNVIPALTFLVAWMLRIEKVNFKSIRSHALLVGTVVTVGGAMIMTLYTGAIIPLPWTNKSHANSSSSSADDHQGRSIKGAIMIASGCLGYSLFYILQSITLKTYPAGLSLTALICTLGTLIGTVLTFIVERGNTAIWAVGWDAKLLAYTYGGIVSSGITYYLSGVIMNDKGPVFVTAFNPFSLVIVAIMSSFIFHEQMSVGKVVGSAVLCTGLYFVVWGKKKDKNQAELVEKKPPTTELPITGSKAADQVDHINVAQRTTNSGHNAV